MKVNYFGYCIRNHTTGSKVLFDLRDFLKSYCAFDSAFFKNSFTHNGENVYIIHHYGDVFYFLTTRSHELIKKINTNNLDVGELNSLLEKDEQLGFSSYLLMKDGYFAFASTMLAPKVDGLASYLNNLFESLGITLWNFLPQALLYQATKEEALKLPHIGRTTIQLSKDNSFVEDLFASISADTTDTIDIDSIEIIIKPKSRKNIKPIVNKFLSAIPDEGVEKMMMKARAEGASQMLDLYLVGRGAISDIIDKSSETKIPLLLEDKAKNNKYLQQKFTEYRADETFEENTLDAIVRFTHASAWADLLSNILQDSNTRSRVINEPNQPKK
jgi:hypothetical protein